MSWYVLGTDGETYGPVDLDTLQQWVTQGRVVRETVLRDAESGRELPAFELAELWSAKAGPVCPRCGPGAEVYRNVCRNCGADLQPKEDRLLTPWPLLDTVIGFLVGTFSVFLFGIGALAALAVYFGMERTHPVFARGIRAGLLLWLLLILGAFATCLWVIFNPLRSIR